MGYMEFKSDADSGIIDCYVQGGYLNYIAGSRNEETFTNVCISQRISDGTA